MGITIREEHINFFDGKDTFKLMHLSYIHLWFSTKILNEIRTNTYRLQPDVIIMTGDYYDILRGAYNFQEFLKKISKDITVVFIMGNHDTMYGNKVLSLFHNIENCHLVVDTVYKFKTDAGNTINFTSWGNRENLSKETLEKNIVLIHNPKAIAKNELQNIDLILAGHLHGGQFIFFKTLSNQNFPGCLFYKYCTDRQEINNTTLIVSKGLGDTFPIRYNCPKEIVLINVS